jgi:hypothetical protein
VKTINYRGPDDVECGEIFANLGSIDAEGWCRITIEYANTNAADVAIYLLVTKVK